MIDKLGFFKSRPDGGAVSAEDERLMQLFQNRAGLKKAHADLKDELHLMQDRLKQQEGATIRVQEQLDALGDLLADPNTGFGALVFFQLRGLWRTCHQSLSAFAVDLTQAQQARETARYQAECVTSREARLADVDRRLQLAVEKAELQHQHLNGLTHELTQLTAFWHYFERRRRMKSLENLGLAVAQADAAAVKLQAERDAMISEANADFPGISLSARRNINLAVIGYAELLCETVDAYGLAARAKEAVARRVHEMTFGGREECEDYMQRIRRAQLAVGAQKQITAAVKAKMERLRSAAEYRDSADAVPTADSLAAPAQISDPLKDLSKAGRAPPAAQWNVLAEDYWDLHSLLMH